MFVLDGRLLRCGMVIWVVGTVALRVAGQRLFRPGDWTGTIILFAVSFPLMAWLVRHLCQSFRLERERWVAGAVAIALPTLVLDSFASAFFPVVYPNMAPQVAGVFGGWMLWCCAGALVGVAIRRTADV